MTNKKGSSSKQSKLSRCMKAAIRFLSKARDAYIQGMTQCSGHFAYVDAVSTLPRSFSVASTSSRASAGDDDFKELVRAAPVRSHGNRVELEELRRKQPLAAAARALRSRSVGIGRIDEDKPCDFEDDIKAKPDIYPRSRSCDVHGRGADRGVLIN